MLARISRWTLPSLILFAAHLAYRMIVIRPEGPAIVPLLKYSPRKWELQ